MSRSSVTWPDYAPWADTVAACRAEFALYGQASARPLIAALRAGAARSGIPLGCAGHLLDGMEADLGQVRLADDSELLRYAYRVSSAVGLMLAPLLGVYGSEALRRVVDLGLALQISNVLLGVAEDARIGRVYLPATRLAEAGLSPEAVLSAADNGAAGALDARLRPVLEGLAALADRYYQSAEHGAAYVPLRYRHGVVLLGRFYAALGRRAAAGVAALKVPSELPLGVKLRQLFELGLVAWRPHVLGIVPSPSHERTLHASLEESWPGVHA